MHFPTIRSKFLAVVAGLLTIAMVPVVIGTNTYFENELRRRYNAQAGSALQTLNQVLETEYNELFASEQDMVERQRVKKENLMSAATNMIEVLHRRSEAGDISEQEARDAALEWIRTFRFDEDGFFFVCDLELKGLAHPIREMEGRNWSGFQDVGLRDAFRHVRDIIEERKEMHTVLQWPLPGTGAATRQTGFFRYYSGWGWIVGAARPVLLLNEESAAERAYMLRVLVDVFREMNLAEKGHLILLDGGGDMLVSSDADEDIKVVRARLKKLFQTPGVSKPVKIPFVIRDDPHIVYTRYFKPFDWYMLVLLHKDTALLPANRLLADQIYFFLVVFALGMSLAYILSGKLTRPLEDLVRFTRELPKQNFDIGKTASPKPQTFSRDEIFQLTEAFTFMADRLRNHLVELNDHRHRLEELVELRTAELRLMNEALRESERSHRTLSENTSDIISRFDDKFRHLYANRAVARLMGIEPEEYIGKTYREMGFPSEQCDFWESLIGKVFKTGNSVHEEFQYDGISEKVDIDWLLNPEFDDSGNVVSVLSNIRDITERKHVENALRESEKRFRNLFEYANDGICLVDANGRLTLVNQRMCGIMGYAKDELEGMRVNDITHPDDLGISTKIIQKYKAGEFESTLFEKRYIHKSGRTVWGQVASSVARDSDGKVLYYTSHLRDVTESKKAAEELLEKTRLNQILLDAFPCPAFLLRPYSREIVASNKAAVKTGAVPGKQCFSGFFKKPNPCSRCLASKAWTTGESQSTEINEFGICWDAHWIPIGRDLYMHFAFDVTHHKNVERALRESEKSLRRRSDQLETMQKIGLEITAELDLEALLELIAAKALELIGGRSSGLLLHRRERKELELVAVAGKSRAKKGDFFPPDKDFVGKIVETEKPLMVADYANWEGRRPDYEKSSMRSVMGVAILWGETFLGALLVESEAPDFFSPDDPDILNQLATQAAVAIRNAEMFDRIHADAKTKAALLREVNHRVGNNLTAISGLLALERRHLGTSGQEIYQEIMDDLTNRVNSLGKVHEMLSASEWAPLSFNQIADRVIHSSLRLLPPDKSFKVKLMPSDALVTAKQAHHLALILNELTTNTAKYALTGRDNGLITVRITKSENMLQFEFEDDGPGYPEDVLKMERFNVGVDLIRQLTRRDLRGSFSLSNRPGAVAIIRFREFL